MTARRGGKLATLILALASVAAALVAAEVGLRLAGAGEPDRNAAPVPPDPELAGLPELRTTLELAQANVRGVHEGVLHRTNSAGMRGPEIALQAPPGTFRIALVGDSVTMGHRVKEEDTYAARLQRAFHGAPGQARVEVLNLGLSGANIRHVLGRLERVGLPYQPDLVVYGFTLNDIEGTHFEPNSQEDRQRYLASLGRFARSPSRLLRVVWPRLVAIRSGLDPQPGSYEYALERAYLHDGPAWRQITRGFDRFAAIGRERGICVDVFLHPVIHQLHFAHPFTRIYARVAEAARARGLFVSEAFPFFHGHDAADLRFNVVDSHPNAEGHRLLAEALVAGLRALPPRCGVPSLPDLRAR